MSFLAAAKRERLAAGVLVGLAIAFVGVALLQRMHRGDADVLLPLALLAADLTVAAALLSGWYSVRPVAQGLAIFGGLAHVLLLLGGRPELIRVTSGLLAIAHVYCLVLLFQLGAGYDYEDDEHEAVEHEAVDVVPAPVAEVPLVGEVSTRSANTTAEQAESPEPPAVDPQPPAVEPEPPAAEPEPAGEAPTAPPEAGQNETDQDQPAPDQAVPVTTSVGAEQAPVSEERAT